MATHDTINISLRYDAKCARCGKGIHICITDRLIEADPCETCLEEAEEDGKFQRGKAGE